MLILFNRIIDPVWREGPLEPVDPTVLILFQSTLPLFLSFLGSRAPAFVVIFFDFQLVGENVLRLFF